MMMTLKEFRTLGRRDFENGAVTDEIERTIESAHELLKACQRVSIANRDAASEERLGELVSEIMPFVRAAIEKAEGKVTA